MPARVPSADSRPPKKDYFFLMTGSLSAGVAALSFLSMPIWVFGVPGVDGDTPYIRGWCLGSNAVMAYFAVWLGSLVAAGFARRSKVRERGFRIIAWIQAANLVVLFALVVIAARMIQS